MLALAKAQSFYAKVLYVLTNKQGKIEAWDDEWQTLDMERVGHQGGKLCERMERVRTKATTNFTAISFTL